MDLKFFKRERGITLWAITALLSFTLGCAESRINSVTTDSPYMSVEKPMLVLKNEHFGGGYTIPDSTKRTYFAGGEIFNYGARPAYSTTIRVRIYSGSGNTYDDHMIYLGDVQPSKSAAFEEKYEASGDYKLSEVSMTYQTDDNKTHTMLLKPGVENINNLDKNTY